MPPITTNLKAKTLALAALALCIAFGVIYVREGETVPTENLRLSPEEARAARDEFAAGAPATTTLDEGAVRAELQKPPAGGSFGAMEESGAPGLSEAEIERIRAELSK